MNKIYSIGTFVILAVAISMLSGVNNYRDILTEYSDYDLIMLTNNSERIELLGRSYEQDIEFYRWSFRDNYIKAYLGTDLVDKSYWQLFQGTKQIKYNDNSVSYFYDKDKSIIMFNVSYYADSRHKTYIGNLIRKVEIYPNTNKETITFTPVNDTIKYNLRWIHETDEYGTARNLNDVDVVNLSKLEIQWYDSIDKVSWSRQYKNGKVKIGYTSIYGKQIIDPIVILGKGESALDKSNVIWKDNCQVRCIDGICNQLIGRTFWVNDSDGICKSIKEAQSLKNSPIKCIVNYDGIHKVECLDWNLTHRKLKLSLNEKEVIKDKNIPLKVISKEWNKSLKKEIKIEKSKVIKDFNIEKEKEIWINSKFDEIIHFGENSTTIKLDETYVIDDSYIDEANTDTNYGTNDYNVLSPYSSYRKSIAMKWDISTLTPGSIIDNCVVTLQYISTSSESGDNMHIYIYHLYEYPAYNISNNEWNETTITWNNRPISFSQFNTTAEDSQDWTNNGKENIVLHCENMLQYEMDNTNTQFSMWFNSTATSGFWANDFVRWGSSEYWNPEVPYLNITYSVPDTTSPTYLLNQTNSTIVESDILHSLKWEDNIGLSGYIFSFDNGTGSFVNNSFVLMSGTSNWSNVTKSINDTIGAIIQWKVYANDSSNNWNESETYSYITTGGDTCTYISGNWDIDCNDNCALTSTDLNGNDFSITGSGTTTGFKNLYNYTKGHISGGCIVLA